MLDYIIIVHNSHQRRSFCLATYVLSQIMGHSSVLFTPNTIGIVKNQVYS